MKDEDILTMPEIAGALKVSESTVRRALRSDAAKWKSASAACSDIQVSIPAPDRPISPGPFGV